MSMSHLNHVRFELANSVDAGTAGTNTELYTPPTNKVLEVKHLIICFDGTATATVDIYDDTATGTNDPVFHFDYVFNADTSEGAPMIYHLGPLDGFYFSKCFQCVATASKVNVMVSGILW